jgi:hypothetical protein
MFLKTKLKFLSMRRRAGSSDDQCTDIAEDSSPPMQRWPCNKARTAALLSKRMPRLYLWSQVSESA